MFHTSVRTELQKDHYMREYSSGMHTAENCYHQISQLCSSVSDVTFPRPKRHVAIVRIRAHHAGSVRPHHATLLQYDERCRKHVDHIILSTLLIHFISFVVSL